MDEKQSQPNTVVVQEGSPWFWRLFGGAVIGIISVLLMIILNGVNNNIISANNNLGSMRTEISVVISELRTEIADLKDRITSLESSREAAKERLAAVESSIKERSQYNVSSTQSLEAADKELVKQIHEVRERLLVLEGKISSSVQEPKKNDQ